MRGLISGPTFVCDIADDYPMCDRCRCCTTDWESCWQCGGEGEWSLHELNPIEYLPDEWQTCDICDGEGGYVQCTGRCNGAGAHVHSSYGRAR